MRTLISLTLCLGFFTSYGQSKKMAGPIDFICSYQNANETDSIKLTITNRSENTTYFFSLGIEGLKDTGWTNLLSNADALGKNEWFGLRPISPHKHKIKIMSMKRIYYIYNYAKIKKIRFFVIYGTDQSLTGKEKLLYASP
jgi:hypothetical protein